MADLLPPVVARLKANISDFQAGMAQAKGEMATVSSKGEVAAKTVSKAFMVGGALAGAALVAFGVKSAHTFESVGKETLKLQKFTGQTAEEASRLRFAFQQTGVSVDVGARALTVFSKRVQSSKDAQKDFGFAVRDSAGKVKPMNVLLGEAAEKFKTMAPGAERTAWVMKNFGRSGMDMTKFLSLGKKGLMELAAEADKYGLVLTKNNLGAVKDAIKGHREQEAAMQGLQVQIGQHVLPAITKLTTFVATNIPKATKNITDHADAYKLAAKVVGGTIAVYAAYKAAVVANTIVTGAWNAVSAIGAAAQWAMATGAQTVALKAMYAAEALTAEAGATGLLSTAMAAAAAGVTAFVGTTAVLENLAKYKGDTSDLTEDLLALGKGAASTGDLFDNFSHSMVKNFKIAYDKSGYWDRLTPSGEGAMRIRRAQSDIEALDKSLAQATKSGHAEEAAAAYRKIADSLHKQGVSYADIQRFLPKYAEAQYRVARAATAAKKAQLEKDQELARSKGTTTAHIAQMREAIAAEKEWKKALDSDWAALNKLQKLKLGSLNANIAYAQAVSDETAAIKANGSSLDINTQAGRDNMNAAMASRQAIMQQAQAMRDNGASAHEAAAFINKHVDELGLQEQAAGLSRDQVNFLNQSMGMTPKEVNTAFKINTGPAKEDVARYKAWLAAQRFEVVVHAITQGQHANVINHGGPGGAPGQNARGTRNWRGGPTWVGEAGPELIDLPHGTSIFSSPASLAAAGGGGTTVVDQSTTVHVAGSVWALSDLWKALRTLALRDARGNPGQNVFGQYAGT